MMKTAMDTLDGGKATTDKAEGRNTPHFVKGETEFTPNQ
jgi:hypothetical protein